MDQVIHMDLEAQGKVTEGSGRRTVGQEEGLGLRSDRKRLDGNKVFFPD